MNTEVVVPGKQSKRVAIGKVAKKTIAVSLSGSTGNCFVCDKPVRHSARNAELELDADVCYDDLNCHSQLLKHFKVIVEASSCK